MNKTYDTKTPRVIDDEMLQNALKEQGPQGQAGQIAKDEGVGYDEMHELRLDYRSTLNFWNRTRDFTKPLCHPIILLFIFAVLETPFALHCFTCRNFKDRKLMAVYVFNQATTG